MEKDRGRPRNADAAGLALCACSDALARMLPTLLFKRDSDALLCWCKVRMVVDAALSGEVWVDVTAIELAVVHLFDRGASDS